MLVSPIAMLVSGARALDGRIFVVRSRATRETAGHHPSAGAAQRRRDCSRGLTLPRVRRARGTSVRSWIVASPRPHVNSVALHATILAYNAR